MSEIATEGGHWYFEGGEPCHEVMGKNRKPRPTTLRDARKWNLFPSVTGIMKCAAAPALDNWKINQTLLAGVAIPRNSLEGDQAWMDRVLAKSREIAITARDLGSHIHGCIEKCLCKTAFDHKYMDHVDAALATLDDWCGLEDIEPEKSFTHPLGYGGKCDAHKMEGFVADFKSKDFPAEDLPLVYDNHAMQLSAYREGFGMMSARCAIIYVSTREPGLTHLVELPEDDLARGWEMFTCLVKYWQLKNNYVPQTCITKAAMEIEI